MGTKKPSGGVSRSTKLKAQLALVAMLTLFLIKTNQENKIIEIFKTKGIFRSHAEKIALWHKDKREQVYANKLDKRILNEVERFLESRK